MCHCFRIHIRITAILAVLFSAVAAQANDGKCLSWDKDVVLEGFLLSGLFPGAPEFTNVNGGDTPFTAQFLYLAEPICADADPEREIPAIESVEIVQIACADAQLLSGQLVTLTGSLFAPHTSYHRARLMLECR